MIFITQYANQLDSEAWKENIMINPGDLHAAEPKWIYTY